MCTLSIIPEGTGHILTMSRDEALTRTEGEPRHVLTADGMLRCWHPVDAATGGTWFGVRGDGMVVALLNRYQDVAPRQRAATHSRGHLTRALMDAPPGSPLEEFLAHQNTTNCEPFDLYVYQNRSLQGLHWDGRTLQQRSVPLNGPRLFTSSSEQAEAARALREQLFQRYLHDHPVPDAEHIFEHLHRREYPANPALAIRMHRPGRATRSICQAQVLNEKLQFRYLSLQD